MTINGDHEAALRAMLRGESQEYERYCDLIDRAKSWQAFHFLAAAAFSLAVQRRFKSGATLGDVIRFVASERVQFDDPGDDIDPSVAERLMLAALGSGSIDGFEQEAVGFAQMSLLMALIRDENLDDAELDQFLAEARTVADTAINGSTDKSVRRSRRIYRNFGPPMG